MVIHELAHLITLEANGIPSFTFFLVIIGGASPIPKYSAKFKQLSWERQAGIFLAGALGNFVVILGAFILTQGNYITFNDFLKLLNLNGVLILWNLFPLWIWDGGRFAKIIFNSLAEDLDTKYEIALLVSFCTLVILLIAFGQLNFIHFWLFFWGLHWQSTHDEPYGSENPKAIPESHLKWWAVLFLIMISAGAIITGTTPNWL